LVSSKVIVIGLPELSILTMPARSSIFRTSISPSRWFSARMKDSDFVGWPGLVACGITVRSAFFFERIVDMPFRTTRDMGASGDGALVTTVGGRRPNTFRSAMPSKRCLELVGVTGISSCCLLELPGVTAWTLAQASNAVEKQMNAFWLNLILKM
jgi:hypothetical protein